MVKVKRVRAWAICYGGTTDISYVPDVQTFKTRKSLEKLGHTVIRVEIRPITQKGKGNNAR